VAREGQNDILLTGPEELVAAAELNILKGLAVTLTYEVGERFLRFIGRNDAEAIEAICKAHNVRIDFRSTEAYIKGRKICCDGDLTTFQSIIAQRSRLIETI